MLKPFALRLARMILVCPAKVYRILRHLATGTRNLVQAKHNPKLPFPPIVFWWAEMFFMLLDLLCVPEVYETLTDFFKRSTRPMNAKEIALAATVFGNSIDYRQVRIDEKAAMVCRRHAIIYVSFHTINSWGSFSPSILIHELVHVWQYRQMGAAYIPRALMAQYTREGYNYGGLDKLKECISTGGSLHDFNLEQQADIITDYFRIREGLAPQWGDGGKRDLLVYQKFAAEVFGVKNNGN
ncbi:MAG: hypothetical protein R2830_13610 [Saprospiraceae bacterium]